LQRQFGGLAYEISVVKFQKQGLPYAYIVVKFLNEPPLSAIDSFISAELPDPEEKPELYHQVKQFHIYLSDHLTQEVSYCNQNGCYIYDYPQPITPYTYMDGDWNQMYYHHQKLEDHWITLHILALVELLDYHIYVNICSITTIFLYLFKYLFKGPNYVRFSLHQLDSTREDVDKYRDYVNACYLSVTEAIYWIFNFESIYKNPSIQCLPVYLEGRNLAQIQQLDTAGFSTMSDLLWYFQ
jgi:hypothetical protein